MSFPKENRVCLQARSVDMVRVPVVSRIPVTLEDLAKRIVTRKATEEEKDDFYFGIDRLLTKLVYRYKTSMGDRLEDLKQECFMRIYEYLHLFDKEKGKFSTWAWRVTVSVLDREYRKQCKIWEKVRRVEDIRPKKDGARQTEAFDNVGVFVAPQDLAMRMQIVSVIRVIFNKFNDRKDKTDILTAMFGNPFDEAYELPSHFSISDTAAQLGVKYSDVYSFWRKRVVPMFKKHIDRT